MNQNNSVVITDTEQNIKFKTHIKLKSNQSGYGLYHINIPLQYEGKNKIEKIIPMNHKNYVIDLEE
ncbi:MAG: hypothetical protein PHD56_09180 [Anaerostipes sp.]|nr:hypothetical protein [Anaerostipes sp.]